MSSEGFLAPANITPGKATEICGVKLEAFSSHFWIARNFLTTVFISGKDISQALTINAIASN
jgi:hypothetical protein